MANPTIRVKRSSVEGKVPAVDQIKRGEFAINSFDGKVFILEDQSSVGIATTTVTVNPWDEPNGVGAGLSYSSDANILGVTTTAGLTVGNYSFPTSAGSEGQALKVNSSGDLEFGDVSSGAGATVYQTKEVFTAIDGQVSFVPAEEYTNGFVEVYLNGVRLTSSDYTADDETTVTLSSAANAGDEVEIVSYAGATGEYISVSSGNVNLTGVVTATAFVGDGSQLTGISGGGGGGSNGFAVIAGMIF